MNPLPDPLPVEQIEGFLAESIPLVQRMEKSLLILDGVLNHERRTIDAVQYADPLHEILLAIHDLQGLAAVLGFETLHKLTDVLEAIFDAAGKRRLVLDGPIIEAAFRAIDRIGTIHRRLPVEGDDRVDCRQLLDELETIRRRTQRPSVESRPGPSQPSCPAPVDRGGPDLEKSVSQLRQLHDETDIPPNYLSIFIDETTASLDRISAILLADESGREEETLRALKVELHRIKGSAGTLGLRRAACFAHLIEDVLQVLEKGDRSLTPEWIDALLACDDVLRSYVERLQTGQNDDDSPLAERAAELLRMIPDTGSTTTGIPSPVAAAEPPVEPIDELLQTLPAHPRFTPPAFLCRVTFEKGLPLAALKAQLIYERVSQLGELFYQSPEHEALDGLDELDQITFALTTDAPRENVYRKAFPTGVERVDIYPIAGQPNPTEAVSTASTVTADSDIPPDESVRNKPPIAIAAPADVPAAPPESSPAGPPDETLRVEVKRLDHLMNLAGELVINHSRFDLIAGSLRKRSPDRRASRHIQDVRHWIGQLENSLESAEALRTCARRLVESFGRIDPLLELFDGQRGDVDELFDTIGQMNRIVEEIQKGVIHTRMLPIGPLFHRFERVIHDMTRTGGKQIDLRIEGEKTELDKRMIDELCDPLIQLVRNAADHGIEPPEERRRNGKPGRGTIRLSASHRGSSIVIEVSDDGQGLCRRTIAEKAVRQGMVDRETIAAWSDRQVHQLIWKLGLSTAEQTTEISGRGVGLEIVRRKLESIGGTIEVESTPDRETRFVIHLPLTLAILPSLMLRSGGETFSVPIETVREIVRLEKGDLSSVSGRPTAVVRGRPIPLVRLGELFRWNRRPEEETDRDDRLVVILDSEGHRIGLVVDEVLGQQNAVVKSLAENYRNIEAVTGASILGDGRISLILDAAALIDAAGGEARGD